MALTRLSIIYLFVNCGLYSLYINKMCNKLIRAYLFIHLSIPLSIHPSIHPSKTSRSPSSWSIHQYTTVAPPPPVITHPCFASYKLVVSLDMGLVLHRPLSLPCGTHSAPACLVCPVPSTTKLCTCTAVVPTPHCLILSLYSEFKQMVGARDSF